MLRAWLRRLMHFALVMAVLSGPCPATADELRDYLQACEARERRANAGIDWAWSGEQGRTIGLPDFQGEIAWKGPVDRYEFRWLAADGAYLYSRIAQQPQRPLGEDRQAQVGEMTIGSEIYLTNGRSRLMYFPNPPQSGWGAVEGPEGKLSAGWGPGSIPLHAGLFGMGRAGMHLNADPPRLLQRGIADGMSDTGIPCTIVRCEAQEELEVHYYLDKEHRLVAQYEQHRKGKLVSKTVVRRSIALPAAGENFVVPADFTTAVLYGGPGEWMVFNTTTTAASLQKAPPEKLSVSFPKTCRWVPQSSGRLILSDAIATSADSLDGFVSDLYARANDMKLRESRRR